MVARRRQSPHSTRNTKGYYSDDSTNMVVDFPRQRLHQQQRRRLPLHTASDDDYYYEDEDDYYCDHEGLSYFNNNSNNNGNSSSSPPPPRGTWDSSPTRNSSSSSSSVSVGGERDDGCLSDDQRPITPVGEVIHVPYNQEQQPQPQFIPQAGLPDKRINHHHQPNQNNNNSFRNSCSSNSSGSHCHGASNASVFSPFLVGLILIGMVAIYLSNSSVGYAVQKASELQANRDRLSKQLYETEKDLQSLKREMIAIEAVLHQKHRVSGDDYDDDNAAVSQREQLLQQERAQVLEELNTMRDRVQDLSSNGHSLKERVQAISRAAVESKYGPGRHFVELELVFPPPAAHDAAGRRLNQFGSGSGGSEAGKPTKFVIEMAPTSEMPHSVHTFLDMVSAGLIDGCSFILNALHVLKEAPLPYDGSLAAAKAKAFSDLGLEGVAFKEYSEKYPHLKYTLGFAADGSPSFYINTADNTDIHVGDPCFARIVDGFDAIQRLESAPTRNGIWFTQKIGIKKARVLPNNNNEYASTEDSRQGLRQQQPSQQVPVTQKVPSISEAQV